MGSAESESSYAVVAVDPYTSYTMFIGPFPDAVEASAYAHEHATSLVDTECTEPMTAWIVPLIPPGHVDRRTSD